MNDSTNGPNAETARDLRDEYAELAALCATLTPEQWRAPSVFYGWSPWDEIAHLCFFDETSMLALNDPEAFVRDAAALNAQFAHCLLYTSPSPRDLSTSRMPSSA